MMHQFKMVFYLPEEWGDKEEILRDAEDLLHFWRVWEIRRLYVHPNSLSLLEPQQKDIAWWNMEGGGRCLGKADYLLIKQDGLHSIIQRNGEAFHWPECEEV